MVNSECHVETTIYRNNTVSGQAHQRQNYQCFMYISVTINWQTPEEEENCKNMRHSNCTINFKTPNPDTGYRKKVQYRTSQNVTIA